ncbi:MAG: tRNA (adenosine(37)-N6)-threonylcarbamoyltransferase complex ATPase subunit type 1 TsaE [Candidatus Marinimicrobia bacterium]|nr:tRNA (adenosine(37)-N6)-threonylcarbamoyltransferase complex ATPase subunit type 1 TsaE [Candidatus Neomarinimicrobiota bacterium]
MKNKTIISNSANETEKIAYELASQLKSGDTLALIGNLASGKTTFSKGFCKYFNVIENVTSPTYTIINEYTGDIPIFHIDCYRINNTQELLNLGIEEYFDFDGIMLIEWPEKILDFLPNDTIIINFAHHEKDDNKRIIKIKTIKK